MVIIKLKTGHSLYTRRLIHLTALASPLSVQASLLLYLRVVIVILHLPFRPSPKSHAITFKHRLAIQKLE
jgi:hypothetical protein